jgi:hypothetical protein
LPLTNPQFDTLIASKYALSAAPLQGTAAGLIGIGPAILMNTSDAFASDVDANVVSLA